MEVLPASLKDVLICQPQVFVDERGYFMETYQQERYEKSGICCGFVQDNLSRSARNTLRGLHYQHPRGQAKLIQVIRGEIFDVAVDIRLGSPSFGQWTGVTLSDENKRQLFVPEGFAHGFCVLSETAIVHYMCSDFYSPESEGGILWADPDVGISWPVDNPLISDKDSKYPVLRDISPGRLPGMEALK